MFKRFAVIVLLAAAGYAQMARFDVSPAQTTDAVNGVTVTTPLPLASITVCGYPAVVTAGSACTNKISVCPDATGVGCTATAPNNPFTADAFGNVGFFAAAGAYQYTVCPASGGACQGPYNSWQPLGITPPNTISLAGVLIPASSGGTGVNNTPTASRYLKGNGSGFATSTGAASGTGALSCTNQVPTSLTLNSDAAPSGFGCHTITTTDTDTTIAKTGTDINTSNQVTATHLAAALPVAQGGTGVTTSTGSGAAVLGTSPTITTPSISGPAISGNTSMATATMSGLMTNYNGIACVSNCFPQEVATVDLTAQTAAVGTSTLYAVPSTGQGQYLLDWNAKVTTAAGVSSTLGALTVVYTDPDGVTITLTAPATISAGTIATTSTANTTSTVLIGMPIMINAKASTNITYAMAYASSAANAMNYNLHLKLAAQ